MTGNGAVDSLLLVAAILGGLVTIGVSVHKIRGLSARLASLENQQTQGGIPWGSTVRLTKP